MPPCRVFPLGLPFTDSEPAFPPPPENSQKCVGPEKPSVIQQCLREGLALGEPHAVPVTPVQGPPPRHDALLFQVFKELQHSIEGNGLQCPVLRASLG